MEGEGNSTSYTHLRGMSPPGYPLVMSPWGDRVILFAAAHPSPEGP